MFKKMKKLCMILVLCLLVMLPCCKKKLPTQADIPTKVLPTIEYFHATPEAISSGEMSILSWSVKNATNVKINQGVGTVSAKDTVEVSPEETTTYTLTATNSDGNRTQSCTVTVTAEPDSLTIKSFTASPESITIGEVSILSWNVSHATNVTIDQGIGDVSEIGEVEVSPEETTTYTLTAKNNDEQKTASCTIEVILNPPIIEYFIANPTSIKLGEQSILSWSVTNADTRIITQNFDPAGLDVDPIGTYLVDPTVTTIFTLTATNDSGQTTSSCEVEILPKAVIELYFASGSVDFAPDPIQPNFWWVHFTVVLQESAGVGGNVNDFEVHITDGTQGYPSIITGFAFNPFGSVSTALTKTVIFEPTILKVSMRGVDDNGYEFDEFVEYHHIWE